MLKMKVWLRCSYEKEEEPERLQGTDRAHSLLRTAGSSTYYFVPNEKAIDRVAANMAHNTSACSKRMKEVSYTEGA